MSGTITSYAQNFEDVMLWRALGHCTPGQYVDIGAQSATIDSVSKAFHEKGWHGVHVEPMPMYAEQLRLEREGDQVIQAVVGDKPGTIEFYEMPETGLSTSRSDLAEGYAANGRAVTRAVYPVIVLDDVLARLQGDIHWLKIDVEGAEDRVIAGWNGEARPWILVIESTLPMGRVQNYAGWEPAVLGKGYTFTYFDGLNRYYVSDAHLELQEAFAVGPNVFDAFQLSDTSTSSFAARWRAALSGMRTALAEASSERLHLLEQQALAKEKLDREHSAEIRRAESAHVAALRLLKVEGLERENALLSERAWALSHASRLEGELKALQLSQANMIETAISELRTERDGIAAHARRLEADLSVIHGSTSWTVTAPLRMAVRVGRAVLNWPTRWARSFIVRLRSIIMRLIFFFLRRVSRSPELRRWGNSVLLSRPQLDRRVRSWYAFALGRSVNVSEIDTTLTLKPVSDNVIQLVSQTDELPRDLSRDGYISLLRLRAATRAARS